MSLFFIPASTILPFHKKITDTAANDVVDATATTGTRIAWFQVNELSGGTPNLTVSKTDGTTTVYFGSGGFTWNAKAMTAKQSVTFNEGYSLDHGWKLQVTISASAADVVGEKAGVARGTTS